MHQSDGSEPKFARLKRNQEEQGRNQCPPVLSEEEDGVLAGCRCAGDGVEVFPDGDWTENSRGTDYLTAGFGISH